LIRRHDVTWAVVVPVLDLSRRGARYRDAFVAAVDRVLTSGAVLLGPEIIAFEEEFAAFTGYAHCVGVSSGATALQLSLVAKGVGPGDEVIVPAHTAVPTASAVLATGATPVMVDVDQNTGALDIAAARAAVTDNTKIVIPVHLYGRPALLPIELGLPILEDAAQAHGALYANDHSFATAYSFYPTKNLGGIGDGGAVVTNDPDLAARLRRLRAHGMAAQYVHVDISQNFRMSEIEAAWLRLLLPDLRKANARRQQAMAAYRAAAPHLRFHPEHPDHVYHLAVVRAPDREAYRAGLSEHGVATGIHYPLAVTQQPAYQHLARTVCPEAEAWAAECVSLPCFPEITDEEIAQVAAALAATP
jgi:dTDP-4-amino-4,6-dideoxygalactose transaminase